MSTAATPLGLTRLDPTRQEPQQDLRRADAKIETLERALTNARTIGIAIGIVVERHHLTREQAFARLVDVSQSTNTA